MADLQTDERRGLEAQQVLSTPIYVEAWEIIKSRIVEQLENADLPADRRQRLNDLLVAHRKARQYMEQVVVTGKMASDEIDRQASLAQRLGEKMRRVI